MNDMGAKKRKAIVKVFTEEGKYLLREIKGLREGAVIEGYRRRNGAFEFKWFGLDAALWIDHNVKLLKDTDMLGYAKEMLYLFVNTYNGSSKWLTLDEGHSLMNENSYWELDESQKPIPVYDESLI